ncbi:urocortin-3 [Pseudophryne corroboree]|uniref:urocortin-3 n=1 Tax=Pseudophryne corroboree TaxID=495146 RepID=UPI003081FA22
MPHTRLLLLLLILCMARSSAHYNFYKAESIFSCLKEALEEVKRRSLLEDNSVLNKRGYDFGPSDNHFSQEEEEEDEEDEKEKRTFPRYRYLSQSQVKGKVYQNKAKSDRRTKFTLSLDVPTHLMSILFDIAKAKNMRAKAAANAQLMAQIGRRK